MPHCNKQMISFFLTTKCNLCCTYCYNAKERKKIKEQTLSPEIAKAGIDFYFSQNHSRHIRFYGPGEPTREFALMKDITEYAKSIDANTTVEIQTNGVFNENIREWMLNNLNIIWLSFDGPQDIQNYNRPLNPKYKENFGNKSSAEILEDNVKWLIENISEKELMIGARVTMVERNIERQKKMVDYFYALGIRHVWTDALFSSVDKIPFCEDEQKIANFHFDMDKYIDYYIDAYNYAKDKGLFWGNFLAVNFDGESPYHCRACTPAPHLTPDGYLSACDMVLLGEDPYHMDPFIFGKWNTKTKSFDLFADKITNLKNRRSDLMSHCQGCEAKNHCGGYCLGEVVNETGRLDGQKPDNCKAIRKLLKQMGTSEPYKFFHP
jgi:radical SAM protein with 4Fe4S-binding SPASM domain